MIDVVSRPSSTSMSTFALVPKDCKLHQTNKQTINNQLNKRKQEQKKKRIKHPNTNTTKQ
jgi:hypothetical protein